MLVMLDTIARGVVVVVFLYAVLVATTQWAIRRRRLTPFGAWPRFVRRISEPVLLPLERRIIRAGGSPNDAPLWLLGIAIVGGLLLITLVRWLIGAVYEVGVLTQAPPRIWLIEAVSWLFRILMIALLVRVIASWLGVSPYSKWIRPFAVLTDWLLEPLRRVLPPMGPLDLSPMVAYFLLWIAQQALVRALL
ncbi:MAG TPA: YggT family protein [Gemmatimonadales bacterium]|jgi:YggT family protein|nr:YggT family protein [Gemmatimonadales bacterium]